jgi:adenylate kinase
MLAARGQKVDAALSLDVDDAEMVVRISGRYTCAGCGEGYHNRFKKPATAGVCDKCGGTEMIRRADDNAETVASRLAAYHAQTAPLIAYYEGRGVLQRTDAMGAIDDIASRMIALVERVTG